MNETDVLTFIRSHRWAIVATASTSLAPQAAIVGIAVTDQLEVVFDTLASSRKAANLASIHALPWSLGAGTTLTHGRCSTKASRTFQAAPNWNDSNRCTSQRSQMAHRAFRGRVSPTSA
jgi:hypothetical protein